MRHLPDCLFMPFKGVDEKGFEDPWCLLYFKIVLRRRWRADNRRKAGHGGTAL